MPRTTTDPKIIQAKIKLTVSESESLRKCAEVLGTTKTAILLSGLHQAEAEVRKREGQAPDKS